MAARKEAKIWEFGDFQTPSELAVEAVASLRGHLTFSPRSIIEPTCGLGNFLLAAAEAFPEAERIVGVDIQDGYLDRLRQEISSKPYKDKISIAQGDFFKTDWRALLEGLPKPILVIGNPPWVTNADIGALQGGNLPEKSNFQDHKGLEALTGKANFDISEWMLIRHLDWLREHSGGVAVLCKTAVARKVLLHAWRRGLRASNNRMIQIDALRHFNASVDACFFITESGRQTASMDCEYYESFEARRPSQVIGYHKGMMLSDVEGFYANHDVLGADRNYVWRSGVKHDCSKVMELKRQGDFLINGNGDTVDIEEDFIFPLLKSSDLANGRVSECRLCVVVTQSRVGERTDNIQTLAPRAWKYLNDNGALLDKRGSKIYKNKPRFSIFGIGPYAFSEWKVAISGFYKRLHFQVVGPIGGRPAMLDDTGYFLSCFSRAEAEFLAGLLNAKEAQSLFSSMIFWSDKRPITVDLLKRLNIEALAAKLGREREYKDHVAARGATPLLSLMDGAAGLAAAE